MKLRFLTLAVLTHLFLAAQTTDYTQYADPMVGTGDHGHTFPGPVMPFGMMQLSPDTRLKGWDGCSGYHYSDKVIYGFTHTHLSGTGCSDYGDILLMPTTGKPQFSNKKYSSPFSHTNEKASPGYYSVVLDKPHVKVELTTTLRTGLHKYTFPKAKEANIILDLTHRDQVKEGEIFITGDNEISGFRLSTAWAKNQYLYFVVQFSKPFKKFGIAKADVLRENARHDTGSLLKAYVAFETTDGEVIYAKVGISAVSIENARKNLVAEQPGWDFDKVAADAKAAWNKELGKIEVESKDLSAMRTFYSALYHSMIHPSLYSDVDGSYRGRDLKVHVANGFNYYTVFSLWDTYRAEHPLLTLIDKKRSLDFVKTFLLQYEQGGLLPVWELSACETNCMIGYHCVPVITEAYMKGVTGFDANEALEAMKKSAMEDRNGLSDYKQFGYIKALDAKENVSRTLEYAYDDWCIAQFAKKLGKMDDYNMFIKRAQNYKNLFDPSTGFMRPKQESFISPFDPFDVNHNYTEANAWQYSFYEPQDMTGEMKLLGGKERLATMLDSLFTVSSKLKGHKQNDISGMIGQYAHGNEPSHQLLYEYDYAGQPWKAQAMARRVMTELYHDKPAGLSGNEDCGQMSAWYVMSALGIYEVCPGGNEYAIGSPLFDKAIIHFENGKTFTIKTNNKSAQNVYINSASLNGNSYNKSYITYEDVTNGGTLEFNMSAQPNTNWGSGPNDVPVTTIQ
ncbi:MAG TPA: GH92 family glycosyl hydrolase [Chitinophagales bacterium]|nr:GH92 family glycosyl hydrolase [Chitinophagales bacterium]